MSVFATFGDWPDLTSLVGSAIIIGAGLFLWQNNRVRGNIWQ